MSTISNRSRDCLGCRIFSGTGLIGIGAYVGFQARNNRTVPGRSLIYGISVVFTCLGVARLANLPPFNKGTATT